MRPFSVAVGLNLAALALLGGLLAAGSEPGGLAARWRDWLWPAGVAAGVGLLAFRFPRSVGLPVAVVAVVVVTLLGQALGRFHPELPDERLPSVQPLTDSETVTVFALRADILEAPVPLPLVPATLYRFRPGDSEPTEWWWPFAVSRGWAHSIGAPIPEKPLKFGVYRLTLQDRAPTWRLEKPELTVPEEGTSP